MFKETNEANSPARVAIPMPRIVSLLSAFVARRNDSHEYDCIRLYLRFRGVETLLYVNQNVSAFHFVTSWIAATLRRYSWQNIVVLVGGHSQEPT